MKNSTCTDWTFRHNLVHLVYIYLVSLSIRILFELHVGTAKNGCTVSMELKNKTIIGLTWLIKITLGGENESERTTILRMCMAIGRNPTE